MTTGTQALINLPLSHVRRLRQHGSGRPGIGATSRRQPGIGTRTLFVAFNMQQLEEGMSKVLVAVSVNDGVHDRI